MQPRVLVVSGLGLWNYGPRWQIFSRFASSGFKVDYVSPFAGNNEQNLTIHKVKTPLLDRVKGRLIVWLLFILSSFRETLKIASRKRPNIIYGYEIFGVFQAFVLSKIFRVPLILRFQGTVLFPHLGKLSLFTKYIHHVLAFNTPADMKIITDDGTMGKAVIKSLNIPEDKVRLWMNGVDKEMHASVHSSKLKNTLEIPSNADVIISISRLAAWKGVARLINAIPDIIKEKDDAYFVIVGEGSEKDSLLRLARKLNIMNHTRFVGEISYYNVPDYLAISDIYVTLQDLSCLSASLMEAMICGKCVVALNSGETAKVIHHNENGILLEYSQLPLLSTKLLELLNNKEFLKKIGERAREYALNNFWTWDTRARKEIDVAKRLIKGGC